MTEQWTVGGPSITDPDVIARLRGIVTGESPLIVEHRFYLGARAPHRFICDDADFLEKYLQSEASAGDSFWIWAFERCCSQTNFAERGKIPDGLGRVPIGGAY